MLPFSTLVTDEDGNPANAGLMTLSVTLDGTPVAGSPFTVAPGGLGEYDQDVLSTAPGVYQGYWLATGLNSGASLQRFSVASASSIVFVSLADLKDFLNIPAAQTGMDQELERFLASATRTVEDYAGPVVPRVFTDRHRGPAWRVTLRKQPVIEVLSVTPVSAGAAVAAADIDVDEFGRAGFLNGASPLPWGNYDWMYRAGRTGELHEDLLDAVKNVVRERWRSQRGGSALPLGSADRSGAAFVPTGRDPLSPLVMALLKPHCPPVVA